MRADRRTAILLGVTGAAAVLSGCAGPGAPRLRLRLWDEAVAEAYRASLAEFARTTGVPVDVVVVPWAEYFVQLRLDIASGQADDVFWLNATSIDPYVRARSILPVARSAAWQPAVAAQYTRAGRLWGVPQLADPGIGLIVNLDLLRAAGLGLRDVSALAWDPSAADDPLRRAARRLTRDRTGRRPGDAGFDAAAIGSWGLGTANDLNADLLQFLAGNGAAWQSGDRFVFDSARGGQAIGYLADLALTEGVAPPSADTAPPAGSGFVREQFLRGRIAMLPTGAYDLAPIRDGASFAWAIAPLPAGPRGALSVTNGVVAAANASSPHPAAQRRLLHWLSSARGQLPIGSSGSAMPAALAAQPAYARYWARRRVDVRPMVAVLANGRVQAPQGAAYPAAQEAMRPHLDDVFGGRVPVPVGLTRAARAGNAAMAEHDEG